MAWLQESPFETFVAEKMWQNIVDSFLLRNPLAESVEVVWIQQKYPDPQEIEARMPPGSHRRCTKPKRLPYLFFIASSSLLRGIKDPVEAAICAPGSNSFHRLLML